MSLTVEAMRLMREKGLSLDDVIEIAAAMEPSRSSAAERQKKYRDKQRNKRDVTRDVTAPLNEIYSNPPVPQSSNDDCPPLHVRVTEAYNATAEANGLTPARGMTAGRRKHLNARVKEHGEPAIFEAIAKLGASDWHCGRKAGSDWKADLGWLLKTPDNFLKILERQDTPQAAPAKPVTDQRAYLANLDAQPWARSTPRAEQPPRERIGKPITLASLAAVQVGGRQ